MSPTITKTTMKKTHPAVGLNWWLRLIHSGKTTKDVSISEDEARNESSSSIVLAEVHKCQCIGNDTSYSHNTTDGSYEYV